MGARRRNALAARARRLACVALSAASLLVSSPLAVQEPVDLEMVTRIRDEGFRRSRVMETASELMDGIGARLTGSPNLERAHRWAAETLAGWGLSNVHRERWGPFGRGWSYQSVSVRMVSPDQAELLAMPEAWSPPTPGVVRGRVVRVEAKTKEDLEQYKGKLAGRVVLFGEMPELKPHEKAESERYDVKSLAELAQYEIPGPRRRQRIEEWLKRREFRLEVTRFFLAEKALAELYPAWHEGGILGVQGFYEKGDPVGVPALALAAEHFGRIARLLAKEKEVEVEVELRARFEDADAMQDNTIAEIAGTDRKGEVVMLGAHFDSWHAGTGATDNGAGVAATMEAIRILQALGVHPRRTIRLALWTGEEQGLYGSRAYVAQHFATRPEPTDPEEKRLPDWARRERGPVTVKPEHAKLAAYFNLDNGTGKVRGIYAEENAAVVPIFEAWLKPFADLGATTVTMNRTGGTDHESFDGVGLPGFQFIQDEIEYDTRTHHTNMDVYERLQGDDLKQASVIIASFVYHAAMRDGRLPRKPLPHDEPEPRPSPEKGPLAKPSPASTPGPTPSPNRSDGRRSRVRMLGSASFEEVSS